MRKQDTGHNLRERFPVDTLVTFQRKTSGGRRILDSNAVVVSIPNKYSRVCYVRVLRVFYGDPTYEGQVVLAGVTQMTELTTAFGKFEMSSQFSLGKK